MGSDYWHGMELEHAYCHRNFLQGKGGMKISTVDIFAMIFVDS